MIHKRLQRSLAGTALAGAALALAACGGGGSTGSLTLGITDAPVDSAEEVNVTFTGIALKPQDGEPITFLCGDPEFNCDDPASPDDDVNSITINLLTLSGDESETLLDGITLAAGRYEWIRLLVNAKAPGSLTEPDPNLPGTTIKLEVGGDLEDLLVPSGPQTGLKLVQGFTVPAGGSASFTIDFDLRKAVFKTDVQGSERFLLRPAFRLVDNSNAGHLVGEIAGSFVSDTNNCPTGDDSEGLAVYVFEGFNATLGELGDDTNEPVATDAAEFDVSDGNYDYRIGFLAAGDYTAAVTCNAKDDADPDVDEGLLTFVVDKNVTVTAGNQPTVLDFP